jgi:hypothetical protein|eukprot:SAG25_NODE_1645_length_2626_cov_42.107638_3_plen_117_part_00
MCAARRRAFRKSIEASLGMPPGELLHSGVVQSAVESCLLKFARRQSQPGTILLQARNNFNSSNNDLLRPAIWAAGTSCAGDAGTLVVTDSKGVATSVYVSDQVAHDTAASPVSCRA